MITTAYDDAVALLDGGWKPEDRDELKMVYRLTDDEVDDICSEMENILNGWTEKDEADLRYREARENGALDYIFG